MNSSLKTKEYAVRKANTPMKRVCLALDLKNEDALIEKYKWHHQPENVWKVIIDGIQQSGIEVMDIYNVEDRLFMICEVPEEADFDANWTKMGTFPRQGEWGELMAHFQQALPDHKLEWIKMERVFTLPSNS
jgi:L-rhamnose mutarotase